MDRKKINFEGIKRLFKLLAGIRKDTEIELIIRDLLSPKEIRNISRRLIAAEMLIEEMTFSEIEEITKMSPITINKINQKLKHGHNGFNLLFNTIRKPGDRIFNSKIKKVNHRANFSATERYLNNRIKKGK